MSLATAINFFSSYGTDECFVLKNEGNKFYIIKNYSISQSLCSNYALRDGIYFELLSGNLGDTVNLNQTFVVKIKNPNSIQVSGTYSIRFYNQNDQLLYETFLPSSLNDLEITYQSINQAVSYIVLLAGSKFIYSSEDFKRGYIPLDQNYSAVYYNPFNQVLGETYFFREKFSGLYFSNPSYRQTTFYKSINAINSDIVSITNLGKVLGTNRQETLSDFKFPSQYRFLSEQNKYYLSSYSLLSYLFAKDIFSSLTQNAFSEASFYNSLSKVSNILPYKEYFYNKNTLQYEPLTSEVDVLDILLSIYIAARIPPLLSSSYNIFKNILNTLKSISLSGIFYPKLPIPNTNATLLPDSLFFNTNQNSFTSPTLYSLGTNLFFINILSLDNETIDPWLREIERIFFDENAIAWDVNTKYTTISDPLQAAFIKIYLSIYKDKFNSSYSSLINSLISQADNYLISNFNIVSSITKDGNVLSNKYNPIYELNVNNIYIYTNDIYKNMFISFLLNEDLQKYLTLGVDGMILDSLIYDPSRYKLILPSLRATLTFYNLSLVYTYKAEKNEAYSSVELINHDTRLLGNILMSTINFSEPVKILALLKVNDSPISYVTSLVPSTSHTIQFSSSLLISSNYLIEIYILK